MLCANATGPERSEARGMRRNLRKERKEMPGSGTRVEGPAAGIEKEGLVVRLGGGTTEGQNERAVGRCRAVQ